MVEKEFNYPQYNRGKENPLGQSESLAKNLGNFVDIMERDPEKAEEIFKEANDLKELFDQFVNGRGEINVNFPGLGKQKAPFVEIGLKNENLSKVPVVFIPGISGGLYESGDLPIKIAEQGRKVVVIGYPESWMGKVTEGFRDAVKQADNFEPHVNFFKLAIRKILGGNCQIDMVGVSTGSIIISELMKDNDFNFRVNQSNLIVPPGLINVGSIDISMMKETLALPFTGKLKFLKNARVINPTIIKKSKKERELCDSTYRALMSKVRRKYNWQDNPLISGYGNKTVVVICEQDKVTKSKEGVRELEENKSLIIHKISGGHLTPGIESQRVIEKMVI